MPDALAHPRPAPSPRSRGADTCRLASTAVHAAAGRRAGADFLARRLDAEAHRLPAGPERSVVNHLACVLADGGTDSGYAEALGEGLVQYAGVLEREGRLAEAGALLRHAGTLLPDDAEIPLHAARVARRLGETERARELYGTARDRGGEAAVGRMGAIGEAILAADPRAALGAVLRSAVRAGEREVAAVAQEERARARRAAGDVGGALRDYLVATFRFSGAVDRGRVLHEAADLASARGDLATARELLLAVLVEGRPEQRAHAAHRLHAVSRVLGDEVGLRRWKGSTSATLVSLTPSRRPVPASGRASTVARRLHRLRAVGAAHPPAYGH